MKNTQNETHGESNQPKTEVKKSARDAEKPAYPLFELLQHIGGRLEAIRPALRDDAHKAEGIQHPVLESAPLGRQRARVREKHKEQKELSARKDDKRPVRPQLLELLQSAFCLLHSPLAEKVCARHKRRKGR